MPNDKLLSEIIDEAAVSAQVEKLTAQLNGLFTMIKEAPKMYANFKGSDAGISNLKEMTEQMIATNKKFVAMQKEVNASNTKRIELEKKLAESIAANTKANNDNNESHKKSKDRTDEEIRSTEKAREQIRQRTKEIIAQGDAYKELVLKSAAADKIAKQSGAISAGTPGNANFKAQAESDALAANKLKDQLKGIDDAIGNHQRHVGDYVGALNTLKPALAEVVESMRTMQAAGQEDTEAFQKLAQQQGLLESLVGQQARGFSSLTAEIRAGEKALQSMRAAGLESTGAFKKLQLEVSESRREFTEFANQQKLLSREAPVLTGLTVAAKGLAGAYAVGAGTAALFAEGNEKVEKEVGKLMAVMTLLQGLEEAHKLLMEKGAIISAITVAWNKLLTAVYGQEAVAAATAAEATGALYTVMSGGILLVIGLLVAGVVLLIDKMHEYSEETKMTNDVNKTAAESAGKERAALDILRASIQSLAVPMATRLQGIKDLRKEYPELFKNLTNEQILTGNVAGAYDLAANAILRKAKASAASSEIEKIASQKLTIQMASQTKADQANKDMAGMKDDSKGGKGRGVIFNFGASTAEAKKKRMLEAFNENKKNDQKEIDDLNVKQDFLMKFAVAGADQTIKPEVEKLKKTKEIHEKSLKEDKDFSDRQLAAYLTLRNSMLDIQESFDKEVLQDEAATEMQKLQARTNEMAVETQLENNNYQSELQQKKYALVTGRNLSKEDKELNKVIKIELQALEIQHQARLGGIVYDGQKDILKIKEKADQDLIDEAKTTHDAILKAQGDANERDDNGRIAEQADAYNDLNTSFLNGSISVKKYADEKERLDNLFAKGNISAEIAEQEQLAKLHDKGSNERVAIDAKIKALGKQASDLGVKDADKAAAKKKANIDKALKWEQEGAALSQSIVDGAFEKKKNQIQKEIELIDQRKEADVSAINGSTLNQQQKAAQMLITTQLAANQKAKLQRDMKAEDIKKAKFDKAAAELNVVVNTAANVIKAGLDIPLAVTMAAEGAIQLAMIMAKPVPQYAVGTTNSGAGPAWVGEKGPEIRINPGGHTSFTPGVPTLTHLERGTEIIPNDEISNYLMRKSLLSFGMSDNKIAKDSGMDLQVIQALSKVEKAIKSQRQSSTTVIIDSGWGAHIDKNVRN